MATALLAFLPLLVAALCVALGHSHGQRGCAALGEHTAASDCATRRRGRAGTLNPRPPGTRMSFVQHLLRDFVPWSIRRPRLDDRTRGQRRGLGGDGQ